MKKKNPHIFKAPKAGIYRFGQTIYYPKGNITYIEWLEERKLLPCDRFEKKLAIKEA